MNYVPLCIMLSLSNSDYGTIDSEHHHFVVSCIQCVYQMCETSHVHQLGLFKKIAPSIQDTVEALTSCQRKAHFNSTIFITLCRFIFRSTNIGI